MSRFCATASISALVALAAPIPVQASGVTAPGSHTICVVIFGVDVGPIHTHPIRVCIPLP
jgi:hypothetical protein